jgi:hypothetical protein
LWRWGCGWGWWCEVEWCGGDFAIEMNGGRDGSILLKITRLWTNFDRTTRGNC